MSRRGAQQYPPPRPERFFTNPPDAYGIEAGAHLVPLQKTRKRPDHPPLRNDEDVVRYLSGMSQAPNERLIVVPLDTRGKPLGAVIAGTGSLNEAPAYPREIFAPVIESRAAAFVLAHNHPSGDPTPSTADVALTKRLLEASHILDVPMMDHIVIGRDRAVSLNRMLPEMWQKVREQSRYLGERIENPPRKNSPTRRRARAFRFGPARAEGTRDERGELATAEDLEALMRITAAHRGRSRARNPRRFDPRDDATAKWIRATKSRAQVLQWLQNNDPNGCWTDAAFRREYGRREPLITLRAAKAQALSQLRGGGYACSCSACSARKKNPTYKQKRRMSDKAFQRMLAEQGEMLTGMRFARKIRGHAAGAVEDAAARLQFVRRWSMPRKLSPEAKALLKAARELRAHRPASWGGGLFHNYVLRPREEEARKALMAARTWRRRANPKRRTSRARGRRVVGCRRRASR